MSASITAQRRVERLRIKAPDDTLKNRALRLLEDAFRTATLPGDRSHLVIVRRVALPRFDSAISPQALALELERRVAALTCAAVHAVDAAAAHAAAVWFRDLTEAHTLLALRILESTPANEWWWPHAVSRACLSGSTDERLRAIVLDLAALDEAPAALCAFVANLASRNQLRVMARVLDDGDGISLLAASRVDDAVVRRLISRVSNSAASNSIRATEATIAETGRSDINDEIGSASRLGQPVLRWIAAMLARAGVETTAIAAHLRALHSTRDVSQAPQVYSASNDRAMSQQRLARTGGGVLAHDAMLRAREGGSPAARARHLAKLPPRHVPTQTSGTDAHPIECESGDWIAGVPTAAGGVLFLLRVLASLGYGERATHICEPAARSIAAAVLSLALVRARAPSHDAAYTLIDSLAAADHEMNRDDRDAASAWLAACRRRLRYARLHLASLVLRPGRLRWSATHLDSVFDLASIDMRVRRAGLDIDPGWVPWMGRVVTFHFERGGEFR